jgi:hypothetical protein
LIIHSRVSRSAIQSFCVSCRLDCGEDDIPDLCFRYHDHRLLTGNYPIMVISVGLDRIYSDQECLSTSPIQQ